MLAALDCGTIAQYLDSFRAAMAKAHDDWELEFVRHSMMGREDAAKAADALMKHYARGAELADVLRSIVTFRPPGSDGKRELLEALTGNRDARPVTIDYTNHRGERGPRTIVPVRLRYGTEPPWHPEPQWLLEADDVEKGERRTFAIRNIHRWVEGPEAPAAEDKDKATCAQCGWPVVFTGYFWDHVDYRDARHPATPNWPEAAGA